MILGLDLGNFTGWAIRDDLRMVEAGTVEVKRQKDKLHGLRYKRLYEMLDEVLAKDAVELVALENTVFTGKFGARTAASQAAYLGIVECWCSIHNVPVKMFAPQTVKRFASGRANATKETMMMMAANEWPMFTIRDDHMADAMWVAELAARRVDG